MTEDSRISRRRYVAERILASYAGRATGREVLAEMEREDFDDPVLEELLDLFVHQPGKSFGAGWLWSSDPAYDEYVADVKRRAAAILADPSGM
jgi:hypothetical protein